jgi:hypothetical protein
MDDRWEELDQLCEELDRAVEGLAERRAKRESERAMMQPVLELLDRADADLAIASALELVRERVLGGLGVAQRVSTAFGLDRLTMLAWPAEADPRPDRATAAGEYRIEVWVGVGEEGRPRVRIVGERRLEATLPVAREKFRAALLSAVRAPLFSPYGPDQPAPSENETAEPSQSAADSGAASDAPESAAAEQTSPPPADDEPIAMGPATDGPSDASTGR